MTTYQQVVQLLGKDFAAILELCKKLFIVWNLDSKKFFSTINHLKKEQVIGLMDGTHQVVRKVEEETKKLFVFTDFFYTRPGLLVFESSGMDWIYKVNQTPKEYQSIENLKLAFDLDCDMNESEIIKKLGGEEKVRTNAVSMDQIEQLIKKQWGGKSGIMLNKDNENHHVNGFYVLENNQLLMVRVRWNRDVQSWTIDAYKLNNNDCVRFAGIHFFINDDFANKNQLSLPEGTIAKKVDVNRDRTNLEAIHATGRIEHLNNTVVAEMPSGTEKEMEILFIPLENNTSVDDLDLKVYNLGLKLADPIAVCAVNEQDPAFADKYPNGTQWRDKKGKACYVLFYCYFSDERDVNVRRNDYGWDAFRFIACVRK